MWHDQTSMHHDASFPSLYTGDDLIKYLSASIWSPPASCSPSKQVLRTSPSNEIFSQLIFINDEELSYCYNPRMWWGVEYAAREDQSECRESRHWPIRSEQLSNTNLISACLDIWIWVHFLAYSLSQKIRLKAFFLFFFLFKIFSFITVLLMSPSSLTDPLILAWV